MISGFSFTIRILGLLGYHLPCVGALKATNNRGLQPAMDHLIQNEGNPVPDPSVSSTTDSSGLPQCGADPINEDEDLDALRAIYGGGAGSSDPGQVEAEAKVC